MELFNMMGVSAPIPEGIFSAQFGPAFVALVAVVMAIGAGLIMTNAWTQTLATARARARRHLTPVQRPALGVAR